MPEETIVEYAKENKPEMIVMGTRGAGKKEKELIGSVTAEVLDSCRFPVLTVPESVNLSNIDDIKHAVLLLTDGLLCQECFASPHRQCHRS